MESISGLFQKEDGIMDKPYGFVWRYKESEEYGNE